MKSLKLTNKNMVLAMVMAFALFACGNKAGAGGGGSTTSTTGGTSENGGSGSPTSAQEVLIDVNTVDPNNSNQLTKISFLQERVYIPTGSSRKLSLTFNPASTTDKSVTWESSNANIANIATVANGIVTAQAVGIAYITATSANNSNISATAAVNVVATEKPATAITLGQIQNQHYQSYIPPKVSAQSSIQLAVQTTPPDATDEIEWRSSNNNIATVSATGWVKFLTPGNVTITAQSKTNTPIKATHAFTVTATQATNLVVAKNQRFWLVGYKDNTPNLTGKLSYTSSNDAVVSVHENSGMFTALSVGTATITIKDEQQNTVLYRLEVQDIPLVKVSGTVSGHLPHKPIVLGYQGYFYFLAKIQNNQYSFYIPKGNQHVYATISQEHGNNIVDYYNNVFSKYEGISRKITAPATIPELKAFDIYTITLQFPLKDYTQRVYAQINSHYLDTSDKLVGETTIAAGKTHAKIKVKTTTNNPRLKVYVYRGAISNTPPWVHRDGTPNVGDATAVYAKEATLTNNQTIALTSSDELKWSKINITATGAASANDHVSFTQAMHNHGSDVFQWREMGSCSLNASKQCSMMVLPGLYKLGLQSHVHNGMPKLFMPIKNNTDLSYFNGLSVVTIASGAVVNQSFVLTQPQAITLTATVQVPQNMDGKHLSLMTNDIAPQVSPILTNTANYESYKLKNGVRQSDGSYQYQIQAQLPKVAVTTGLSFYLHSSGGSFYQNIDKKSLNSGINLGVVVLEQQ